MAGVVIKKCGCKGTPDDSSKFQDKKYGDGMRVMNLSMKGDTATCTICNKETKV